jgi:uncharacterized protein YbdZ (MbtH family)
VTFSFHREKPVFKTIAGKEDYVSLWPGYCVKQGWVYTGGLDLSTGIFFIRMRSNFSIISS